MSKTIKIARYRGYPFTVNCPKTNKTYTWAGSMANKMDIKSIPQDTYDYLFMETTTFVDGALVVLDEDVKDEIKESMLEEEYAELESNTHTRGQIEKILNGNTNAMKAILEKITKKDEKRFVVGVAVELKLDSAAKRAFLCDWFGAAITFED